VAFYSTVTRFGEIAWLIDVGLHDDGRMIGDELHRHGIDNRSHTKRRSLCRTDDSADTHPAEIDWMGRISKCGDKMLRSYLYDAVNVVLIRVAKWSALRAWGVRLATRIGLRKAKIAVARKLAVILHRTWIEGAEFRRSSKEAANQPA
jgi:hypothetical protein